MTVKQLLIVDVADIRVLRLECLMCGTAISFKPTASAESTGTCSNCGQSSQPGHKLDEPRKDDSRKLVQQFVEALRNLQVSAPGQTPTYRVHFEIERPPS